MPIPPSRFDRTPTTGHTARVQAAAHLVDLVDKLIHQQENPRHALWQKRLTQLINHYLQAGRDDVIDAALHSAAAGAGGDVIDTLARLVEAAAQSPLLGQAHDGTDIVAHLFAIPVLMMTRPAGADGALTQGRMEPNAGFHALLSSFLEAGFMDAGQALSLSCYLYHPSELDALPRSAILHLTRTQGLRALAQAGSYSTSEAPPKTGWPAMAASTLPEASIGVRFLVGVLAGPRLPDGFCQPDDAAALPAWTQKMTTWHHKAGDLISVALNRPECCFRMVAGQAVRYYCAVHTAQAHVRPLRFASRVAAILKSAAMGAHQVRAIVAPYGNDGVVQHTAASLFCAIDGHCLGVAAYPMQAADDPDSVTDMLQDTLTLSGITEVATVNDMAPALPAMQGAEHDQVVQPDALRRHRYGAGFAVPNGKEAILPPAARLH